MDGFTAADIVGLSDPAFFGSPCPTLTSPDGRFRLVGEGRIGFQDRRGAPDHRPDPFDPRAESRVAPLRGAPEGPEESLI